MTAITISDLNNAKTDVDHIAEVSNSLQLTAVDRQGHTKDTVAGAVYKIQGITNRGAWASATSYSPKDIVSQAGTWYICVVAHTSSGAFATDSASKWRVYQGVTTGDLSASGGASMVGFIAAGVGAVLRDLEEKGQEVVSILDYMTLAQRVDAISGTLSLDLTAPIQAAIDHLENIGGGILEWYDAKVTGALTIQGSDITIRPRGGNRMVQAGASYNTFRIYPSSLDSIWAGPGRPPGFETGIDGAPELLMYEADDDLRLRNVQILGLDFEYTGGGVLGRFIDAFSVDGLVVERNKAVSGHNVVNLWYCRDAKIQGNDLECINNTQFTLFMAKSYGVVDDNCLRNAFNAVDAKGCYPQAGKTVLEAFDVGYNFNHPVRMTRNRVFNPGNAGLTSGYYDNSGSDISSGAPSGVTKKAWYGETWGVEYLDNTIHYDGTPAVNVAGVVTNVNSKYHIARGNVMYGVGILCTASVGCEFEDNTIIDHRATSTAPITLQGGTYGATSRNATDCVARRNRIFGGQSTQASIRVRGGDYCTVEDNQMVDGATGTSSILVDSTASASTSTGNQVLRNTVRKAAADFAHPVRSTGAAGTVIDGNRAFGGWYNGNSLDSDGFANAHYKRGVVSADTPTAYVGSAGTCSVGQNFGDQNIATPTAGYADEMAVNGTVGGGWRQALRVGANYIWTGVLGNVRFKATAKPASDTDGAPLGRKVAVPGAVNTAGLPGDWAADTTNFYVYTGDGTTHTWRRVAVAAF